MTFYPNRCAQRDDVTREACAKAFAAEPAFATGGFVGPQDAT